MRTISELFRKLLASDRGLVLGEPLRSVETYEAYYYQGSGSVRVISFSEEGYQTFITTFGEHLASKHAPKEVTEKLIPFGALGTIQGRQVSVSSRSPAVRYGKRVMLPAAVLEKIVAWLNNRLGKHGGKLRNQIEKVYPPPAPPRIMDLTPPPARPSLPEPVGAPPAPPIVSTVADDGALDEFLDPHLLNRYIGRLSEVFDVQVLPVVRVPALSEVSKWGANGKDGRQLLGGVDDLPTIWVLRDPGGFHAALFGPKFAVAHEERVRSSDPDFRLQTEKYSGIRACRDLRALLHPTGMPGEGACVVTWWNRVAATLVSLPLLIEALGLTEEVS